jgi:Tfp pilus assembly PilM family ATPase
LAVAAPRTRIVETTESLARGRLECEWVEPAALALVRACRATAQSDQGEIWGVLDLGYSACRLYLAAEATPVFARHVRGSGHAWTELIARELRIEYGLAEHYKRKCGIGSGPRGSRSLASVVACLDESALPGVLSAVLKGPLTDLVADVEKAFCFVMEQYPRRQAGGLVLVGGGSRMPGLPDFITDLLGVRTVQAGAQQVLNIPGSHPMSRPDVFSVMAGCVGLALGEHRS